MMVFETITIGPFASQTSSITGTSEDFSNISDSLRMTEVFYRILVIFKKIGDFPVISPPFEGPETGSLRVIVAAARSTWRKWSWRPKSSHGSCTACVTSMRRLEPTVMVGPIGSYRLDIPPLKGGMIGFFLGIF